MWIQWTITIGILVIGFFGIAAIYGSYRWQSDTNKLRAKLVDSQTLINPPTYDLREIEGLPDPVQRFFRTVMQICKTHLN